MFQMTLAAFSASEIEIAPRVINLFMLTDPTYRMYIILLRLIYYTSFCSSFNTDCRQHCQSSMERTIISCFKWYCLMLIVNFLWVATFYSAIQFVCLDQADTSGYTDLKVLSYKTGKTTKSCTSWSLPINIAVYVSLGQYIFHPSLSVFSQSKPTHTLSAPT